MCKSIQSARETKGLLFALRTCTRAALCNKYELYSTAVTYCLRFDTGQFSWVQSFFVA